MKVLCATILAAALATGGAAACERPILVADAGSIDTQGFISKEWIWSDGASTTTFTAFGPPEQVNSLDPENGIVACPDCQLASSMEFGSADVAAAD